jgi:hypothetical protein
MKQAGAGPPIVVGAFTFVNKSNVRAFVHHHVRVIYLGVLTDVVVLLQKMRITNPTKAEMMSESTVAAQQNIDVVKLSLLIQSFAVLLPAPFTPSGQPAAVVSMLHVLPSVLNFNCFADPDVGRKA